MESDLLKEIINIEEDLIMLPKGKIVKKNVNGETSYYLRIETELELAERPIEPDAVAMTRSRILQRKKLEKKLEDLYALGADREDIVKHRTAPPKFDMDVMTGERLTAETEHVSRFKRRDCFEDIKTYVYGNTFGKVLLLCGLKGTGKSTLMRQVIADMDEAHFARTAFIETRPGEGLAILDRDMERLYNRGYRYIFINEISLMDDFIEGSALLSDVFAEYGMKIVLSGTDSLSFRITKDEALYNRCFLIRTTFVPYREFERVLGLKGIDEYIQHGGAMSLHGGTESTLNFSVSDYVDRAIGRNIQTSLKNYQYEGHFRHLWELYEKHELSNAIDWIVGDINRRFISDAIADELISNGFTDTTHGILEDAPGAPTPFGQSIGAFKIQTFEIGEYLDLIDLTYEINVIDCAQCVEKKPFLAFSQPWLRYTQAEALVTNLLVGGAESISGQIEKEPLRERMLEAVRERMAEDIVLLETKIANPNKDKDVLKMKFDTGELDMVVMNIKTGVCEIFEITLSNEITPSQYRLLRDAEICSVTEKFCGNIAAKYVLYRGDTTDVEGIHYVNVEDYLKSL